MLSAKKADKSKYKCAHTHTHTYTDREAHSVAHLSMCKCSQTRLLNSIFNCNPNFSGASPTSTSTGELLLPHLPPSPPSSAPSPSATSAAAAQISCNCCWWQVWLPVWQAKQVSGFGSLCRCPPIDCVLKNWPCFHLAVTRLLKKSQSIYLATLPPPRLLCCYCSPLHIEILLHLAGNVLLAAASVHALRRHKFKHLYC